LNTIQALYDTPAWPDFPVRSTGIGLIRRLTCLIDRDGPQLQDTGDPVSLDAQT